MSPGIYPYCLLRAHLDSSLVGEREKEPGMGLETGRIEKKLDRAELLALHEHYATEMRASLDFAHRNLSFYVGLLSAILAALLAGILKAGPGDLRALWLLSGSGLAYG